ncbi:MAG: metal dependent phosphohydrolase [Gemmatimonadetes bacterium]|nr:metal dependent phosphohydrolase [Gemmatimonadota bacterium]
MKGNGERPPQPRRPAAAPDDAPGPRLSVRLRHAGVRVAVLLLVSFAVYLLFPAAQISAPVPERGALARADVVARVPFVVPKTAEALRQERAEAAGGVPPVYLYVPGAADSVLAGVRSVLATADSLAARPGAEPKAAAREALERARLPVTAGSVDALADPVRRREIGVAAELAVRGAFPRGVTASPPQGRGVSALHVRGPGGERLVPADSVHAPEWVFRAAAAALPPGAGADAGELERLLLIRFFRPSLEPDDSATDAARARARRAVDTVSAMVLRGEKVVGAHEQVGEREAQRLRAYQAALESRRVRVGGAGAAAVAAGSLLHNLLLLGILAALLRLSRRSLYDDDRAILFLGLLVVLVAAASAAVARAELPAQLIPVPLAALLVAALWGGRLALAVAMVMALLIGGQTPFLGLSVPFALAVSGAAAAFGVRVAERRLQTWIVVAVIAAAAAAAALASGLLRAMPAGEIGWTMLWGCAGAVGSSLLAMGLLPLAELFTGVTTNQTLMELADPKRPLLRRLAMEAPGTYAHTISVANLAESVCGAIGANPLLARVGVLYHDIGKVVKPQYFIENQPRGRNPHDRLKPSMSAAIVRSHVVEGLRLAEEARLPAAVRAFIAEHHGTQPISFFLEQARAADPDGRVNAADFAYLGPRPRSRETAVAMLADSVESASRVLADPTPQRLRELVDRIVAAKVAAGQLDESPLTLRDLSVVREHLAKGLMGMYHHRVDYPAPAAPASVDAAAGGAASTTG